MDTLLKEFPVITEIKVAWGEMDALQHVNNAVYFSLLRDRAFGLLQQD